MGHLRALPMQQGWIYEAIISTYAGGTPHAAPIGVWTEDFTTLHMEIYDSSMTLQNVMSSEHFAANFPKDVQSIYAALFRPHDLLFEEAQEINAPLLCNSSASVELALNGEIQLANRVHITGTILRVHAHQDIKLINRAESLLLESLIVATRLRFMDNLTARDELAENYRVIRKVAPNSSYARTMEALLRDLSLDS